MAETRCPHCSKPVRAGARFCGSCGKAIALPLYSPAPAAPQAPCRWCGSRHAATAQFCPVTGKPVAEAGPKPGFAGPVAPAQPAGQPWSPPAAALPGPPVPPAGPSPVPGTAPPTLPAVPAAAAAGEGLSLGYRIRHVALSLVLTLGLFAALAGVYAWDRGRPSEIPGPALPPTPSVEPATPTPELAYPNPVVEVDHTPEGRFGLRTTMGDPGRSDDDGKNLTYSEVGDTGNTRVWVDGETPIFGSGSGRMQEGPEQHSGVLNAVWEADGVRVTQQVEIVAGSSTRRLDTLRIRYLLENADSSAHEVGLRIMIDTLIGDNDGVPFVVPGREGITDRAVDLQSSAVPDFIQALEVPDLLSPGVIVNLTLAGGEATRPDRLVICGWWGSEMPWDFVQQARGVGAPLTRGGDLGATPDSAVGLYYNPVRLEPGQNREVVAFYGLGSISSTETRNPVLSLAFSRQVSEGDKFWIVAMVVNPKEGQSLRLELPAGVALATGETAEKPVQFAAGDAYTQVSWLAEAQQALDDGRVQVVLSPDNITEAQSITVLARGVTR
jgi:hypothetical protein